MSFDSLPTQGVSAPPRVGIAAHGAEATDQQRKITQTDTRLETDRARGIAAPDAAQASASLPHEVAKELPVDGVVELALLLAREWHTEPEPAEDRQDSMRTAVQTLRDAMADSVGDAIDQRS